MRLALAKDYEIYDRKLLGLTLRERLRKTLERAEFEVKFFSDGFVFEEAESYLILPEPVLILERDVKLEGRKVLCNGNLTVAYLVERDFLTFLENSGDVEEALNKYFSQNGMERQEIWAIRLSEESLKEAENLLLISLIKAKRTGIKPAYYDGFIAREINRRVSLRITKLLAKTSITPNQITVLSFFLSVAGSLLFLFNSYLTTAIAGVVMQLHSIIDGCDGEMARLKFMESRYGAWLDGVLDRYADFIAIFCITLVLASANAVYWIVGFMAAFATLMIPYTGDKFVAAYKTSYAPEGFAIPITRDVRLFLIFVAALINHLWVALVLIAILGNLESLRRIFAVRKM